MPRLPRPAVRRAPYHVACIAVLTITLAGAARAQRSVPSPAGDSARITAIADALWARLLDTDAGIRLRAGLPVRRLPVTTATGAADDAEFARALLARLDRAGPQPVGSESWRLAAVTRARAEEMAGSADAFWFRNPVSPYANAFADVHAVLAAQPLTTPADLTRYLDLAAQYAGIVDAVHGYLRGQQRRGYRMPKPEVQAALTLLRQFRAAPDRSPVAATDARLAAVRTRDPAAVAVFRARLTAEVTARINPAFDRLIAWLAGPYLAAAPTTVGLAQYPGGAAHYRRLVRASLTVDRSPEAVHDLGLREVARITAELDSIRAALGDHGPRADFHRRLRTDPRFVPTSPDAVRDKMLGHLAALRPRLAEQFATVPAAPYDVQRLDPALEAGMTYGYYRQPSAIDRTGIYFFNGGQLDRKTTVWFEGLAYHEILPGHHFHLALVQEQLAQKHPLRRTYASNAYTEGWGEYAAALAESMGGYRDPYDRYGRRIMELYSAVRLVLDTGLNLLGWSHERALAYLREHSIISDAEVASEVLRYCCDIPGQALGYRMGMLAFQGMRTRAAAALGPRFDPRAFHQLVLADGPLPFFALEERLDVWLAQQGAATDQPPVPPVQAISLLGDTLRALPLSAAVRERYARQLAEARAAYEHTPTNLDSLIWYARRLGYLGQMRDAIAVYGRGIAIAPDNPWLYRHRGHRYLSVRDFPAAVADLERAAALVAGTPDVVEPDGQPNAQNTPIGTLHSNIDYHLALAYYLQGRYDRAADVAGRELAAATNDDRRVSMAHWLYLSLRRQGKDSAAAALLTSLARPLQVIENDAYARLIRLYQGQLAPEAVLTTGPGGALSVSDASAAYGVAAWYWITGRRDDARALWRRIVAAGQWGAFGTIAAEAELARGSGG